MSKFVAWQVVSLMKNEQQSQNLLLKVDPRSTFRNKFLEPATNVFVARQVDHAWWKTETSTKLATKQCCATSWGFFYLVFRRLKCVRSDLWRKSLVIFACDQLRCDWRIKSPGVSPALEQVAFLNKFCIFLSGTLGTPFLPRIFCLFCFYVTVFEDYFLLRYLLKFDSNSVSKFLIIFILPILFLFCPTSTVRLRNFRQKVIL